MKTNKILLPLIVTIIAAVGISSCTYRSAYNPGYDYGYRYGHRHYYRMPPPPPHVVVVKPAPRRVIHANRHRPSRQDNRHYRQQHNRGNHYGNRQYRRSPR